MSALEREPTRGRSRRRPTAHDEAHADPMWALFGALQALALAAQDETELLTEASRILCEFGGFSDVLIALTDPTHPASLRPLVARGAEGATLPAPEPRPPQGTRLDGAPEWEVLGSGRVRLTPDVTTDTTFASWKRATATRGARGMATVPLGTLVLPLGVLDVLGPADDAFDDVALATLGGVGVVLSTTLFGLREHGHAHRGPGPPDARSDGAPEELGRDGEGTPVGLSAPLEDAATDRHTTAERSSHVLLLTSMDRLNRAIQGATELDALMHEALEIVLDVMGCERASLMLACDPTATTWSLRAERSRCAHGAPPPRGAVTPMTPAMTELCRRTLATPLPVVFGMGTALAPPANPPPADPVTGLAMALHPSVGPAWGLGIHRCQPPRPWRDDEIRLFQEVGRRLESGLTGVLATRELRESEAYLRTLVQTIPDLVWVKDPHGVYLSCNRRFERFFGVAQAQILGKTDYDFVSPELADFFRTHDRNAMAAGVPSVNEEWLRFADDGYYGLFETVKTPLYGIDGELLGVLGVARDITEHHRAERELRIAAAAFEAQEGIVITDADQVVLRVNNAFTTITGYDASDIVGQPLTILRSDRHDAAFHDGLRETLDQAGAWQGEVWSRRKSGEVYPEWLTITAVAGASGAVTHYVVTLTDITSRKAAEREIELLAFYDPLTDLPNRRLLLDRLQHALTAGARSDQRGALLFIDLDNFKLLNDTRGHDVGDRLLVHVAQRLSEHVRAGDTVARLGGDEFVVMLEHLGAARDEAAARAKLVAEKLRRALKAPYTIDERTLHSTPSIGVTLFAGPETPVDELLKQADIAMYQAKGAGRNAVRFYDPEMEAALEAKAALESALRSAIHDDQFELYYQPQVDGIRGLVAVEALLRWHHPERGLVAPTEFIALAEETGLIREIGHWVLSAACLQLRRWADTPRLRHVSIAVNVSAHEFRQPDFVARVQRALETSGAPPQRLELELTESVVLADVSDTVAKMRALKALGVGFALDDFGTGYSSLAYLTQLPLDQLKIDRTFVRNLPTHTNDAVVVQSIISLGQSLGLVVVAEGVETEEQRAFLADHRCMTWQGYLFGRPMPPLQFERRWPS